jgi:hypothetical protein
VGPGEWLCISELQCPCLKWSQHLASGEESNTQGRGLSIAMRTSNSQKRQVLSPALALREAGARSEGDISGPELLPNTMSCQAW